LPTSATDSQYQHPSSRSNSRVRSLFASSIPRRCIASSRSRCQPLVGSAEASPRSDPRRLQSLARIAKRRETTVTGNPASGGDAFDGATSSFDPVHHRASRKKPAPRSRDGDLAAALSTACDADHVISDARCRLHVFPSAGAKPSSWFVRARAASPEAASTVVGCSAQSAFHRRVPLPRGPPLVRPTLPSGAELPARVHLSSLSR